MKVTRVRGIETPDVLTIRAIAGAGMDQHASATLRTKPLGRARADAAPVSEDQPAPRYDPCLLCRRFAFHAAPGGSGQDHGLRPEYIGAGGLGHGDRFGKPGGREQLEPPPAREKGMRPPSFVVREPPPTLRETERDVQPTQGTGRFRDDEEALRGKKNP